VADLDRERAVGSASVWGVLAQQLELWDVPGSEGPGSGVKLERLDPVGVARVEPVHPARDQYLGPGFGIDVPEPLRDVGEVYVIDSQSTDCTSEIAEEHGAQTVQFHYEGGWPKKRQWAMDSLQFAYDWIFIVDADEALTPELADEIRTAIRKNAAATHIAVTISAIQTRSSPSKYLHALAAPTR